MGGCRCCACLRAAPAAHTFSILHTSCHELLSADTENYEQLELKTFTGLQ